MLKNQQMREKRKKFVFLLLETTWHISYEMQEVNIL